MKTKYFLLYVIVGIAFLAASAWVYFSCGKSAKAIRAKYKLGGILLMCLSVLSTASCGEILTDPEINAQYAGIPEECGKCALLQRCGGGCRAASEQVHGTFSALDPILDFGR